MADELKTRILASVKADLDAIETALAENLKPHLDLVARIARHILFSGGKRLRPLLMVLSARLCGYKGGNETHLSTIFEFLHAATLLHDDLVDEGLIRRGRPAAHTVWGGAETVLVGDFLLARSLTLAAETDRPRVINVIAEITENMSQGEIHQLAMKGNLELSEEQYMEIIRAKTAVLFQGACRVSAMIADAGATKESALKEYGYHLGIAFQMADDLLDYTSDLETLGKNAGADLREGKLTLPVIYALRQAGPQDRRRIQELIAARNFSIRQFERLLRFLDSCGAIVYTRRRAVDHIEKAKASLAPFADCREKQTLSDIADYALVRSA